MKKRKRSCVDGEMPLLFVLQNAFYGVDNEIDKSFIIVLRKIGQTKLLSLHICVDLALQDFASLAVQTQQKGTF